MRESQNPIRLNDRPLPEGHDEELLRLAHRLEIYRDPEQLIHALPAELFDLFHGDSLILALSEKSISTLGFDPRIAIEEGLQTLCILPLSRGNRVLVLFSFLA